MISLELREKRQQQYKNRSNELSREAEEYWLDKHELLSFELNHAKKMLGNVALTAMFLTPYNNEI